LWGLSSFGPKKRMDRINQEYAQQLAMPGADVEEVEHAYSTAKLENSYAGLMGKSIEPVIKPLGYDWKIGIAIITSFAAREVFVGTMATLYSVGDEENDLKLKEKMQAATWPDGSKVFTLAAGVSLMVFYVFAMQCMSTLAIVRRETRTWKWPIIQFLYMTGLAYVMSWLAFEMLK